MKEGDVIYCVNPIGDCTTGRYVIAGIRIYHMDNDFWVIDDIGHNHYFGMETESDCSYTNWFITEKQYLRNEKINTIINGE